MKDLVDELQFLEERTLPFSLKSRIARGSPHLCWRDIKFATGVRAGKGFHVVEKDDGEIKIYPNAAVLLRDWRID